MTSSMMVVDAAPLFAAMGVLPLARALTEQLGLALEQSTAPYDVIVVDAAKRSHN